MFRHKITMFLLVTIVLMILVVPTTAVKNGTQLQFVNQITTNTFKNLIYNNTLYLQEGTTVKVYNVSPGKKFSNMKYSDYTDEIFQPMANARADNNKLYILGGGNLSVYSLTDKYHPLLLGSVKTGGSDFIVDGTRAYVSSGKIYVYDISDPTSMILIGNSSYSLPATTIAYDGHYIYTGSYDSNNAQEGYFATWDISDPSNIRFIKYKTTNSAGEGMTYGLAYYNNTLYVSNAMHSFQTWDVTNRSNPVKIWQSGGSFPPYRSFGAMDLQIVGNYLYTDVRYGIYTDYGLINGGFVIANISSVSSSSPPIFMGANGDFTGYTESLSTDGTTAVISSNTVGFTLYNVSNKNYPITEKHVPSLSEPWVLTANTIGTMDVLAHSGRDGGTWYWNITDPTTFSSKSLIGAWDKHPLARQVQTPWSGNYSYPNMGTNGGGAWIVNLTGIEKPNFVIPEGREFLFNTQVGTLFITDTRIYSSTTMGGVPLQIYNNTLKDTASPALITNSDAFPYWTSFGTYRNNTLRTSFTASNGTAYRIWGNISDDPSNWKIDYTFYTGKTITSACGNFNYTYAMYGPDTWKTIRAINITTPGSWYWESGTVTPYISSPKCVLNGTDIFVYGNDIAPTFDGSIAMIDFSNHSAPHIVDWASAETGESISAATFKNGYLYTGGGKIAVWKVIPSSSTLPKTQHTIGSQNQQSEQQSNSFFVYQNIINQITEKWRSIINYLIHHFPIQL